MRFIWKITLGLILLNSMLVLFSSFFAATTGTDAINITSDATFVGYKVSGSFAAMLESSVLVMGVAFGIGILGAWAVKSTVPIGVGLFAGFLVALYIGPATVLYNLDPTNNWIISGIISILGIIIGILAALSVTEMFAGQTGVD